MEAEVSVMFSFQNGTDIATSSKINAAVKSNTCVAVGADDQRLHRPFEASDGSVTGILMQSAVHNIPGTDHIPSSGSKCFAAQGETSFAIATSPSLLSAAAPCKTRASSCSRFVSARASDRNRFFSCASPSSATAADRDKGSEASASRLWRLFVAHGDIAEVLQHDKVVGEDAAGTAQAAAVCLRKTLRPLQRELFPFALAWATPIVRFGGGDCFRRYFTRFFGHSGDSSAAIAAYALHNAADWDGRISAWHSETLSLLPVSDNSSTAGTDSSGGYYRHQLFNELYFLVDGGTIWTDTSAGLDNPWQESRLAEKLIDIAGGDRGSQLSVSLSELQQLRVRMLQHDEFCQRADGGDQSAVGQFMYLEGHEYLMYNTYDVHFYASFALLMLWPQLELSLQKDFALAVCLEDRSIRRMMGEGALRPRKVAGSVPHDLGSPTEAPWRKTNAYNFQDVSNWKDLGPKFVLQIYRDLTYLKHQRLGKGAINTDRFLQMTYPILLEVMHNTAKFDCDDDGMIENSGFPDQTYDIWTAKGVHAYCGGLWISACNATCSLATQMGDGATVDRYRDLAGRAQRVYVSSLWNGRYLDYDSSSSKHHDSVMADMLAGHWYARACGLPALLPPRQVLSCLRTIFQFNVLQFGGGQLMGAVNGMRPPRNRPSPGLQASASPLSFNMAVSVVPAASSYSSPSGGRQDLASIDHTCLQSREVWTGTTYALAATMLHEARHVDGPSSQHPWPSTPPSPLIRQASSADTELVEPLLPLSSEAFLSSAMDLDDVNRPLTAAERRELTEMSHCTARGIHDAGWQRFGYWFATPEAWEKSGNYRSLGYMRPLAIWAIQYVHETSKKYV
mmetsp:Transcript_5639/g.8369  ORF Transcript_5639/g.8369 Transcript_5639/m.8369 type:complete len:847 (-) Transcript_5639:44-2584(-)